MSNKFFKVKIVKHTPIVFGRQQFDNWHKKHVGETILVKETNMLKDYYECKIGHLILKVDCEIINK